MEYLQSVEAKIVEAMEAGLFDNLEGAGQPLRSLGADRFAGGDRLGFRVLSNNGFLPAWLQLGKEIEALQARLDDVRKGHATLVARAREGGEWAFYARHIRAKRDQFEAHARRLRARQDQFNLDAPGPATQRPGIWVEYHLEKLDAAVAAAGAPQWALAIATGYDGQAGTRARETSMAGLKDTLQEDLKQAMRARDETRKSTVRMLIAAVKNAEIAAGKPLSDEEVVGVLQKQAKQRRESITEFEKGNRQDLVQRERAELELIEAYLPAQADPAEIEAAARKLIADTGATGPRDIGKVMPSLMKQFAGRADGKQISEIVRGLLAG
ncbi:MAG: hypothetical protein Kow0010_03790 [Dehalococcoidia bacterium]